MPKLTTSNITKLNNPDKDNWAFDILPTTTANNKLIVDGFTELANNIMKSQNCTFLTDQTLNTTNNIESENISVVHESNVFQVTSTVEKPFDGFLVYDATGTQIVGAPFRMVLYTNNRSRIDIIYTGTLTQTYRIVCI